MASVPVCRPVSKLFTHVVCNRVGGGLGGSVRLDGIWLQLTVYRTPLLADARQLIASQHVHDAYCA